MRSLDRARRIGAVRGGVIAAAGALAVAAATVSPVAASTTYAVTAHFSEPIAPSALSGCPAAPEGFCGFGRLTPFGSATEIIAFGGGGGGSCDLRTITLAAGPLLAAETLSGAARPRASHPKPGSPPSGFLSGVV